MTRIYGVLGYPAKHSLSPLMHHAAFRALEINAEYKVFEVKPQDLDDFLGKLYKSGIFGLNVTVPYKEAVLKYLQWESPEVKFTGASNTLIVKDKEHCEGWNTDGIGFHRHLTQDLKFDLKEKTVAMLGAGGAAKAIADQCGRQGVRSISIYDTDRARSLSLTEKIHREFPKCKAACASSMDELDIENSDLLINATPVGMKESDPSPVSAEQFHSRLFVYDLVYNPPETNLLKEAKEKGARVANGLGMLLYQGARSFELWTGKTAPLEIMREALNQGVQKHD
jgi:shikimate dehydrogenase